MQARVPVDETDFRILREVFQGDAESFRSDRVAIDAIAARLGLHRNTVSARLKRLTEARVLLPASLEIEPAMFGVVGALAFFDAPAERRTDALRDALFAIPGVQVLFTFLDGIEVILYAESEPALHARIEEVRRLCGATRAKLDVLTTRDYPPAEAPPLTPLDARVIVELLEDARASFSAIAKTLDVTAMTVKRRYARLVRSGALYLYPSGGAPIEGIVMGFLAVDFPDPAARERVDVEVERLVPNAWIKNAAAFSRITLIAYAKSVHALEAQVGEVRRVPGVAAAELRVFTGIAFNPAHKRWLADLVARRVGVASWPA